MNIPPVKIVTPKADREAILRRIEVVLLTGQFSQGANVLEFEDGFKKFVGMKHAAAVSSGGAALEIVLRYLGVKDKDVLVPTNTFFATASAVMMAGGHPVLVDSDIRTMAPTVEHLEAAITPETVGMVIVHIGGHITPDIERIQDFCEERGIWLFEDCAHAHGSEMFGKSAGTFGIAGAYSFFPTKVMTSGEGGMVVTNDQLLDQSVRGLRDYGKPSPWESFHTQAGGNWRMSDITGAVGAVQLKRLPDYVSYRQNIASWYLDALHGSDDLTVVGGGVGRSSYYKFVVLLPDGVDKARVKELMKEKGVSLSGGVYDRLLHQQPVFADEYGDASFPEAEEFARRHVCLPVYYTMSRGEVSTVVKALRGAVDAAG